MPFLVCVGFHLPALSTLNDPLFFFQMCHCNYTALWQVSLCFVLVCVLVGYAPRKANVDLLTPPLSDACYPFLIHYGTHQYEHSSETYNTH